MKSKRINWKKQLRKENFWLKAGRMPTKRELENNKTPRLIFGLNTVSK